MPVDSWSVGAINLDQQGRNPTILDSRRSRVWKDISAYRNNCPHRRRYDATLRLFPLLWSRWWTSNSVVAIAVLDFPTYEDLR